MLGSKEKRKLALDDPDEVRGPIFSVRFLSSLLLIAAGIVYVVLWTLYVRDLRTFENHFPQPKGGAPDPLIPGRDKLYGWNWLVGFGLPLLGLAFAAHPTTPLGRGPGAVFGLLACFPLALLSIFLFSLISI